MEGKRFLRSIELKNILSYGPEGVKLELEPLNVLIGPNASGKSNLFQVLRLLHAAPRDIKGPPRWDGSGIAEWMWKGGRGGSADIEVEFDRSVVSGLAPGSKLGYRLIFQGEDGFHISNESLAVSLDSSAPAGWKPNVIVDRRKRRAVLKRPGEEESRFEKLIEDESIFSQIRDPSAYPVLTDVGYALEAVSFFSPWKAGERLHLPQRSDLPSAELLEDGTNLGPVLRQLLNRPGMRKAILEKLRLVFPLVDDIIFTVVGGFVELALLEPGLGARVPASRLSDGTLHYLCLLAILLNPEPPPLVCIEEPELGLHPDAMSAVGELLIEASQRTQLIVTTHSPSLISALSNVPEAVVVCERDENGTQLRRLEPEKLGEWLNDYSLGDVWLMGAVGGNR